MDCRYRRPRHDKSSVGGEMTSVMGLMVFVVLCVAVGGSSRLRAETTSEAMKPLRIGIIGLDTSHSLAFTELLNQDNGANELAGCRVVAVYPPGSPDIESSVSRLPAYKEKIVTMGVEIVDTIPALLERVDAVLLESNDGRPHLEQLRPVLAAHKPVFVDKPVAGTLVDSIKIYREAAQAQVPIFSSSSLRYTAAAQQARRGELGKVFGCDARSPCSLEKTHPDLFWYGIHGVESLFTVMGTGCEQVVRMTSPGTDVVMGQWSDGRIGTFRGIREGHADYGGTIFTEKSATALGGYEGYRPLVVEIVKFFRSGKPPVDPRETLEIYAFMEAADASKRQGGAPVRLETIMQAAQQAADSDATAARP